MEDRRRAEDTEESNILVAVRARPLSKREQELDSRYLLHALDSQILLLLDPTEGLDIPEKAFRQNRSKVKQYAFDVVFGKSSSQELVFDQTTRFLVDSVLNGYNASVFAYGATGAGKTYTMVGEDNEPGLMLNTFTEMFNQITQLSAKRDYKVKLSYLEIYNEIVRDLLISHSEALDLREDPGKGVLAVGLTEIMATSPQQVIASIRHGNKRRTCEPTEANSASSRSHAVLTISVEHRERKNSEILVGKLSLIDLAGSERASHTKNRGMRLIEGANINRSLLALGNCINALCEAEEKGTKVYIPYRDSKLTRLLKDSLGGNCRTVMIACISPFIGSYDDTLNTLTYANRAKNIKTNISKNVISVQYHIARYTEIIKELKEEIGQLRQQAKAKQGFSAISIEEYLIDLNSHFKEEAGIRKAVHLTADNADQLSFLLYNKQVHLDERPDKATTSKLKQEISGLTDSINKNKQSVANDNKRLKDLEKKRGDFEKKWEKDQLDPPSLYRLRLEMKKNILNIQALENGNNDDKHQKEIKQKDLYINLLEDQLRIRDSIIYDMHPRLIEKDIVPESVEKNVKALSAIYKIEAKSLFGITDMNNKKRPAVGQSKIPKPRHAGLSPSSIKVHSRSLSNKTPTHRSNRLINQSVDSDAGLPQIARKRVSPNVVKYGMHIRNK